MGWITQGGLGVLFILIVTISGFTFLVDVGNFYGVEVEEQYKDRFGVKFENGDLRTDQEYVGAIYDAAQIQEGGDIDSGAQDAAQSPGSISAVTRLNFFSAVRGFFSDLSDLLPFNTAIISIILGMIAFSTLVAIIALFTRGRP